MAVSRSSTGRVSTRCCAKRLRRMGIYDVPTNSSSLLFPAWAICLLTSLGMASLALLLAAITRVVESIDTTDPACVQTSRLALLGVFGFIAGGFLTLDSPLKVLVMSSV
mmetsp:Transcript_86756/g.136870  ORF Transcript_86756/g.136870 Transcript_86756/m.136870 type:complete len:109 (-) Transcript_86756:269-595(-)